VGKILVFGGAALVVLGLLVMAGFPLFRLPGDFTVRRGPVTFYFPLATSILLSILVTLVMMFFRK
jgi:hypothetical protein